VRRPEPGDRTQLCPESVARVHRSEVLVRMPPGGIAPFTAGRLVGHIELDRLFQLHRAFHRELCQTTSTGRMWASSLISLISDLNSAPSSPEGAPQSTQADPDFP